MKPSPIEKIQATNEFAEIWWDSSPLVFDAWRKSLIDGKSDEEEWQDFE